MARIEVKDNEYVYLNERYEVCSSGGCCAIGTIEMDLQEDVWVYTTEGTEDMVNNTQMFYQEELEQILYVVDKLNKRDKLGKYNKKEFGIVTNTIAKPLPF